MSILLSNNNRILDTIRNTLTDLHALQFDGTTNSYVTTLVTLTVGSEASIECFYKPTTIANNHYIIGFGTSGSSDRFYLTTSTGNKITAHVRGSAGVLYSCISTTTFVNGTIYHIGATYSLTDNKLRLYVNGIEESNVTTAAGTVGVRVFQLGGATGGGTVGILDNARFYQRKLSSSEMLDHVTGIYTVETSLNANWKCDAGFGRGVNDTSGNNNHGIMSDSTSVLWVTRLVDF